MRIDPDAVAAIIRDVADNEILPRFGRLRESDIDTKTGPQDFVTEADRAAERALADRLGALAPGAGFVGEEGVAANPAILDALDGDDPVWIVDPLDGTRNFVRGKPEFGTIVSLVRRGEILGGWIYAAPDGKMAIGMKGEGATWGGASCGPLPADDLPEDGYRAIGNILEPWKSEMAPRLRAGFETAPADCSAYVYIRLLTGEKGFALYTRCSPWDHAAGVLMLREIGGRAEYLDTGAAYAPRPVQGRPRLVSGSEAAFKTIAARLLARAPGR